MSRSFLPQCDSQSYKKNGHTHNQKQNHRCKVCGRPSVLNPDWQPITDAQKKSIEGLLLG